MFIYLVFCFLLVWRSIYRAIDDGTGIYGWWGNIKDYLLLIVLLTPQAIQDNYQSLNLCINLVRIILLSYFCCMKFLNRGKVDWLLGLIIVKSMWILISNCINQCTNINAFKQIAIELLLYFCVEYILAKSDCGKHFFVSLISYMHICIVTNFITILENGIYWSRDNGFRAYFLGDKNTQTPTILVAIIIPLICAYTDFRRFKRLIIVNYIIAAASAIIVDCGTLKAILIIGGLALLPFMKWSINRIFFVISIIFLEFIVVIVQVQSHFANVINLILQKQASFTGRTFIWEQAIKLIEESPWIGHGYGAPVRLLSITRFNEYTVISSAHNAILQVGLNVGMIGVVLFGVFFLAPLFRKKSNNKIVMFSLFVFFLSGLTETYLWCAVYCFVYFLLFYLDFDNCYDGMAKKKRAIILRYRIIRRKGGDM